MATPFIGEVRMFAGDFAPIRYAFCLGQLLPIAQNTALFSILGTAFGGDGVVTFGLPNLGGRTARGVGQGPGLSRVERGEQAGTYTHTLTLSEMPAHTHTLHATTETAGSVTPENNVFAAQSGISGQVYGTPTNLVSMSPTLLMHDGAGFEHENTQPFVTINYIIALEGIFPPRG